MMGSNIYMEQIQDGIISITQDLIIDPTYTFEQFKNTAYYNGQDGIRVIDLENDFMIDGRKFCVSLFFRNGTIYMLSLICCDVEISFQEEEKRKAIHDEILANYGIDQKKVYGWGYVSSSYDARSNISSIDIVYKK